MENWQVRTIKASEATEIAEKPDVVALCDDASPAAVLALALDKNFNHVVQEKNPHVECELRSSIVMMDAPPGYFNFPLTTILTPENLTREQESKLTKLELPFWQSKDKESVLSAILNFMETLPCPSSLRESVTLVADELFTNAIFNAAFVHSRGEVSRQEEVVLSPNLTCRMLLGADADRIVLVCEDLFGSLDVRKLLVRIKRCYEEGAAASMTMGIGGAGIGSYMVFERSMSLYYGVQQNKKTTIACVFPIKRSRKLADPGKSIHFIIYDDGDKL